MCRQSALPGACRDWVAEASGDVDNSLYRSFPGGISRVRFIGVWGCVVRSEFDVSFFSLSTSEVMQDWWFVLMVGAAAACFVSVASVVAAVAAVSVARVVVAFVAGLASWLLIDASFVDPVARSATSLRAPVEFPATIGDVGAGALLVVLLVVGALVGLIVGEGLWEE